MTDADAKQTLHRIEELLRRHQECLADIRELLRKIAEDVHEARMTL